MVASIPGIKSGVRQRPKDKTNIAVLWNCQHGSSAVNRWLRCNRLRSNAKRTRYYSSGVSVEWRNSVYIYGYHPAARRRMFCVLSRDTVLSIIMQRGSLLNIGTGEWLQPSGTSVSHWYQHYSAKWRLRRTVVSQHVGQMNRFEKSLAIWKSCAFKVTYLFKLTFWGRNFFFNFSISFI